MISERVAMAKVRGRIRREIATAEEEEHEGGELNLVPYLDILVNTIIFLLATTASAALLVNINVNSPRYESAPAAGAANPDEDDKPKLNLTVAISYEGFVVAGSGGVMTDEEGSNISVKCQGPMHKGRCPAFMGTRVNAKGERETTWRDMYGYKKLAKLMMKAKKNFPHERQVILTADRHVPYKVVVATMDALRGRATEKCTGEDGCMFDQIILSAGVQ